MIAAMRHERTYQGGRRLRPRQRLPPGITEEQGVNRRLRSDVLDRRGRFFPKWAYSVPTSFAMEADLPGSGQA